MRILVDADLLVYRAGFATQYPQYTVVTGEDTCKVFQYKKEAVDYVKEFSGAGGEECEIVVSEVLEPKKNAIYIIDSLLGGISAHFGVPTRELQLVLSGRENFRDEVAVTKPYKGGRKPKPTYYEDLRSHLEDQYNAHVAFGEEADDWLGYTQYLAHQYDPENSVIVTIDKDLDMIPGLHYNFVKEIEYYVDELEADRFFMHQLLMGDGTDNIQGIAGCGPATAKKHLKDVQLCDCLPVIHGKYVDAYGDKADEVLEEMATLLWIRRAPYQHWTHYFGEKETWIKST